MGIDDLRLILAALSPSTAGTLPDTTDDTLSRYLSSERLSLALKARDRFGLTVADFAGARGSVDRMVYNRLDNQWRPLWAPSRACQVQMESIAYGLAGLRIGIAPWRVGPTDDPMPVFRHTTPGQPPERARVRRPIAGTPYHDCAHTTAPDPDGFIRCRLCRRVYHERPPAPGRLTANPRPRQPPACVQLPFGDGAGPPAC